MRYSFALMRFVSGDGESIERNANEKLPVATSDSNPPSDVEDEVVADIPPLLPLLVPLDK